MFLGADTAFDYQSTGDSGGCAGSLSAVTAEWFTAAELAELALPGLPADKRSLNRRARDERWLLRSGSDGQALARPRAGRGGGTEFHHCLLPGAARLELAKRGLTVTRPEPAKPANSGGWRWYEGQSAKTKAEAVRRNGAVREIGLLETSGLTRTAAVAEVSRRHGTGSSTLWSWLRLIEGVGAADFLPALAPRYSGGGAEAEIDPALWNIFKSDYLRASAPTLAICFAKCAGIAAERGLSLPSEKTFSRKLAREVDPRVIMLARQGEEALRRSLPSQRRTVGEYHALELVNIDGHKFDVFVTPPPDGSGAVGKPIRPVLVGIQDVYSRKLLAWRIGETETAVLTRLAFADLFANFGIPKECFLDNGRAFASKWITGGAKSRFRFKIKPEEPTGLLTALGIKTHFTLPYRGQSKPIERAWRDLCDVISKCAAFDGAYTGNSPVAKPENYASRAVPWAEFVAEVERGIHFHNARQGRRTEGARGRSFDEVFAASYATAPIGKASEEQHAMALLMGENLRVDNRTGEVSLYGNRYWSDGCGQLHGSLVTVRFDPDNLARDIRLYDLGGRYLTSATMIADTGFGDVASAKQAGRLVSDHRKKYRAALEAEQLMAASEVAAAQRGWAAPELPEPAVLRPVRHRGQTAAALKLADVPAPRPRQESRIFAALDRLRVVE